jgi:uncharacterized protein
MLFIFDELAQHNFWMKNTLIPLDIVWLDAHFQVVDTATMVPCTADLCPVYMPQDLALYALEINAGGVEKWGIHTGELAVTS